MLTPQQCMQEAVQEARSASAAGKGKPFGAVVVRGGEIVGRGANLVFATGDPTDHAELLALRQAAQKLGRMTLEDCEIHATGQPCLMCLGAIFLLRVPRLYYANSYRDAEALGYKGGGAALSLAKTLGSPQPGFDGDFHPSPALEVVRLTLPETEQLYRDWAAKGRSL